MTPLTSNPAIGSVKQIHISAPGPNGALSGTMTLATDPSAPVVLIIPGSGPTDRDGNSPLGVKAATYRLLAEELAIHGVTTVRIDKRGMFASAGACPDANAVTVEDYVVDIHSWVNAIREKTGSKCVWLLGHSEGGLVALKTVQQAKDICGLILLATPGRPLGEGLKEQLRANPANEPLLTQSDAAIDTMVAGKHFAVEGMHPALAPLFREAVQGFLISLFKIDPCQLAARVEIPVLIIQGERDLQVGVTDAKMLKAASPTAKLVLLPDANHVLKPVISADRGANFATYADPHLPLVSGVTEVIADFVRLTGTQQL